MLSYNRLRHQVNREESDLLKSQHVTFSSRVASLSVSKDVRCLKDLLGQLSR